MRNLPDDSQLRLVVASTPRSGTTYLSNVLHELGIRTGHEAIFSSIGYRPEWASRYEIDVTGFVGDEHASFLQHRNVPIVLWTRHPVKTINSICAKWPHIEPFHVGSFRLDRFQAVATLWYHWIRQLSARSDMHVRLEDGIDGIEEILHRYLRARGSTGTPWTYDVIRLTAEEAPRGDSTPGLFGTYDDLPEHIQSFAWELGYKS